MKATLEFNLPEDQDAFDDAVRAQKMRSALSEVWLQVFRPAFKHGYPDKRIDELMQIPHSHELVERLGQMYHEILEEYGVRDVV